MSKTDIINQLINTTFFNNFIVDFSNCLLLFLKLIVTLHLHLFSSHTECYFACNKILCFCSSILLFFTEALCKVIADKFAIRLQANSELIGLVDNNAFGRADSKPANIELNR